MHPSYAGLGKLHPEKSLRQQLAEVDHYVAGVRPFLLLWLLLFVAVAWLTAGVLSRTYFCTWLLTYALVYCARTAVIRRYLRSLARERLTALGRWVRALQIFSAVHAGLWGLIAWLAIPALSLPGQLAITWLLAVGGAIATIAVPTGVVSLRVYLSLSLGPTVAAWALLGSGVNWMVAVGVTLMGLVYDRVGHHQALDLRQRLSHANELMSANEMLEKFNVSKTRLIVEASHDLRQPVHAMGMMLDRVDVGGPRPEIERRLGEIQSCMNNVSDMLIDLLDLSRLETGEYIVDLQPVDLGLLLSEIDRNFAPVAQRKGVKWMVYSSPCWVLSDPAMLRRILNNLISNAIKYTSTGSVGVSCSFSKDTAKIRVIDTGRGIPAHKLEMIFLEYVRLDDASQEPGYGIGLSVVRRMADLLGHRLSVKSREGQGSRFTLSFHKVEAAEESAFDNTAGGFAASIDAQPLAGKLVIFIENDELLRSSTAEVLRSWGAEVVLGSNMGDAIANLSKANAKPDLVISDMHLGEDMDGLQTIAALRKIKGHEQLPAILLTGDLKPELQARTRALDIRIAYKPVRPARLREMLIAAASAHRPSEPMPLNS